MNKQDYNNTSWPRMSKEGINACPIRKYDGPVHLISSAAELSTAVIQQLKNEKILGFDTETRPAFRKGEHYSPALIQLAGESCVFIIQLKQVGLPRPLLDILADPEIIKAGVSIDYDISELRNVADFVPAGFVDLGDVAKGIGIQNHGLRGLSAVVLGFRIGKGASTSNWESRTLTHAQIKYAATDAWVGRELYNKLKTLSPPIS